MTTTRTNKTAKSQIRFPDIPERTPDDMTSAKAIHLNGRSYHLGLYFAGRPGTVVDSEHYINSVPTRNMTGVVYPDLLVSFDADPEALERSNAYVISEQDKPPDFILEIASRRTRRSDRTTKRDIYAALEVPEYWRFNEAPTPNRPGLAGDRLVDGQHEPMAIDILPDGRHRGYSPVLNLILEWQDARLNWIDPETESHIPTFELERDGRLTKREGRLAERAARLQAEARTRELEAELRSLRGE